MQKTKQYRKQTVSLKLKRTYTPACSEPREGPRHLQLRLGGPEAAEFLKQVALPLPGAMGAGGFPSGPHCFTRRPTKPWRTGLNSARTQPGVWTKALKPSPATVRNWAQGGSGGPRDARGGGHSRLPAPSIGCTDKPQEAQGSSPGSRAPNQQPGDRMDSSALPAAWAGPGTEPASEGLVPGGHCLPPGLQGIEERHQALRGWATRSRPQVLAEPHVVSPCLERGHSYHCRQATRWKVP